jgi:hypothetical protein
MKLVILLLLLLCGVSINVSAQNYKTKSTVPQKSQNQISATTAESLYGLGDISIRLTTAAMRNEGTRPTTYSSYLHLSGIGFKRNNLVNVTCSCQINTGAWVDYPDQVFRTSDDGKLAHYFSTIDDKTLCKIRAVEVTTKRVAVTGWKK